MSKSKSKKHKIIRTTTKYLYMFAITIKWLIILVVLGGLLVGSVAFGYASALVKDEPLRSEDQIRAKMQQTSVSGFIYFNDDSLIGQIRSPEDRTLLSINEVPERVKNAFLAVEDSDFNSHWGVDISGFLRALKEKLLNDPRQSGGSTITQQVTKLTFFSTDVTDERKAKEILLALRLERYLSKDEILETYLNKIPFGRGSNGYYTYGLETAAKGIFDVEDLNLLTNAQSAYLAGLPQNPNKFSAYTTNGNFDQKGFEEAMERQRFVLERMLAVNMLTEDEYNAAVQFDLKASLAPTKKKAYSVYPFLMLEAERKAAEAIILQENPEFNANDLRGEENADLVHQTREQLRGGFKIYTTIDKEIYDGMQEIAQNDENFTADHAEKGMEQTGAILLDNKTGAILSMIEGRDFYEEQLNHATQMKRQPGSAMKPIAAYLPAIDSGKIQPASIIDDIPLLLPDWTKGYHIPVNYNDRYHGLITARYALNESYNIPALRLFNDVIGIEAAWKFVRSLGITTITENDNNATTGVIGGMEYGTTVEELTNAYASIANQGKFNDAYMIRRIEDADGNIIYEHESNPTTVVSEESAYLMTDMLRTVISSGTGTKIKTYFKNYDKIPVVGKTGTTSNNHDIWFMGYSPDVTLGVWTGYDQPSSLLTSQGANNRARNLWSLIMDKAVELKPELFGTPEFEKPENIVSMTVSDVSGKLPSELTRQTNHLITDIFNKKFIPEEEDDILSIMKVVNYNQINYIPLATTPDDMIREKAVVFRDPPLSEYLKHIEEILNEMPDNHRPKASNGALRSIGFYYPQDIKLAAPSEADPRIDDGFPPNPPTGVVLTKVDDSTVHITFEWSPNSDVVGYRLYRSYDGRPFVYTSARNVLTGDEPIVKDGISNNYEHAYYLTAVDVSGKESVPSQVVSTNENLEIIPEFPEDILDPNDDGTVDDNNSDGEETENNDNDIPQSNGLPTTPQNVEVSSTEGLLSIEVTWDTNPQSDNINRYIVYHSEEKDGNYNRIGASNTTQFEYPAVPSEGWYIVVAENNNGPSNPSDPVEYK